MDISTSQAKQYHAELRDWLGPVIMTALRTPGVTDITVGRNSKIFLKKGITWKYAEAELPIEKRKLALNVMATLLGKKLDKETCLLQGKLPLTGDRVQASCPPSSEWEFEIRTHAGGVFTLDDYVLDGTITQWQAETIRNHVLRKSNIVFAGETGSRKTSLVNACLWELRDSIEHIVTVEDTEELQILCQNVKRMLTNEPELTMLDQINAAMRLAPDRIIIGEVRGEEGHAALRSFTRGNGGGIMTMHAESAEGVLDRCAEFCEEAGLRRPPWRLIRRAINLIVHLAVTPNGCRVSKILEVSRDTTEENIPIGLVEAGPHEAVTTTW